MYYFFFIELHMNVHFLDRK
ncbi:hypothetical protein Ccrd_018642 [Cynara cardunculus var. scolymus]|uniref:Uncharacterized protein n=1 Tax=Cynara cardunculus var. scolymus TaxID=59895 RepID=A0A103Y5U9_CYNCS|nr:hypothetical protein Ccrd_018642 [Cynara cardunculus var. scolymus]